MTKTKKLSHIASFLPKSKVKAGHGLKEGLYPFFTSSDTKVMRTNDYLYDGELIVLGTGGSASCNYYSGKFAVSTDNYVIKTENSVLPKFLYYFLRKDNLLILQNGFRGSGLEHISKAYISNIDVPLFDIPTQKRIVDSLDLVNSSINFEKELISNLDSLIKSRFNEMFGNPVDNPHNFKLNYLSNLGYLSRGKSKHRPRNDPKLLGGPYPLIQTGDVKQADLYISHYESTYSEFGLNQSKLWPKGTLCITIAANIAETAILKFDACFPDSVVGFIANEKANTIFIRYQIEALKEFLNSKATEVAQKNLNIEKLESVQFMTPEINLQNEFASFVEQVDKLKFNAQERIKLYQELLNKKMDEYFG